MGRATHLSVNDSVAKFQEGETVEQGRKDMQEDFARNVSDISPVSGKCPLEQLLCLSPVRGRIFAGPVDVLGHGLALALLLHFVNFLGQFLVVLALFPNFGPVFVSWSSDDIDRPFTAKRSITG